MWLRQLTASFLVLLTACSGVPRSPQVDRGVESASDAAISIPRKSRAPVALGNDEFQKAVTELRRDMRPSAQPMEAAWRLFQIEARSGSFRYDVRSRELRPSNDSPLEADAPQGAKALTQAYLRWCEHTHQTGDCMRLLANGPQFDGDGRYALAMAIAQGSVLNEMQEAFKSMADPQAVLSMVLWTMTTYLILWTVPEPISKGIAATLTAMMMAYLGVDTVWRLIGGWRQLVEEVDQATSFEEIRASGERFGRVMGQNAARVFVLLATAAMSQTASGFVEKVPTLPGARQASLMAEAEGSLSLTKLAEVKTVTVTAEGATLTLAPGAVAMSAHGMGEPPKRSHRHHIATNKNLESDARRPMDATVPEDLRQGGDVTR